MAAGNGTPYRASGGSPVSGTTWEPLPGFSDPRPDAGNADTYLTPHGQDAIMRAYQAGLGVLISKTSDGGALSLNVYDGERKYRQYAGNQDEADRLWEALDQLSASKGHPPTAVPMNARARGSQLGNTPLETAGTTRIRKTGRK